MSTRIPPETNKNGKGNGHSGAKGGNDNEEEEAAVAARKSSAETMERIKALFEQEKELTTPFSEPLEMEATDYQQLIADIAAGDYTAAQCQEEYIAAARFADLDILRACLQACSAAVLEEAVDAKSGNTALHMAAANGHVIVMALILKRILQLQQEQEQQEEPTSPSNKDNNQKSLLLHRVMNATNHMGNTALHYAAANGKEDVVNLLLYFPKIFESSANNKMLLSTMDVLQQNKAGRSALTEGFTSQNTAVIQALLEHESATEERLMKGTVSSSSTTTNTTEEQDQNADNPLTTRDDFVIHDLVFWGTTKNSKAKPNNPPQKQPANDSSSSSMVLDSCPCRGLKIREMAMAKSDQDTILGQVNPANDTTGYGIWASSLIMAQWMVDYFNNHQNKNNTAVETNAPLRILELGAGCGVPGLALARALSSSITTTAEPKNNCKVEIFLTDFNPKTVNNLQYNIQLNPNHQNDGDTNANTNQQPPTTETMDGENYSAAAAAVTVHAQIMNWQDPSTWPTTGTNGTTQPIMDYVIGSDLIYQSDMVPLLVQTVKALLLPGTVAMTATTRTKPPTFLYCAPVSGRQGQEELLVQLKEAGLELVREQLAPVEYLANPLQSGDDDLCYLHFTELFDKDIQYKLYEFRLSMSLL